MRGSSPSIVQPPGAPSAAPCTGYAPLRLSPSPREWSAFVVPLEYHPVTNKILWHLLEKGERGRDKETDAFLQTQDYRGRYKYINISGLGKHSQEHVWRYFTVGEERNCVSTRSRSSFNGTNFIPLKRDKRDIDIFLCQNFSRLSHPVSLLSSSPSPAPP